MKPTNQSDASLTAAKRPRVASVVMIAATSIVLLIPAADNYRDTRASRIALEEEVRSHRASDELQQLKLTLARMQHTNDDWQRRSVASDSAFAFQNEITNLARELKCRVRHCSLAPPHRKPWKAEEDPFEDTPWISNPSNANGETSHVLAIQSLKLTIEGSYPSCGKFISTLQSMDRLIGIKSIELQPTANHELIEIDIDLMMFTLETPTPNAQAPRVDA